MTKQDLIRQLNLRRPDRIYADEIAADLEMTERNVKERVSKRPGFPATYRIGKKMYWKPEEYVRWRERQRD